MIKPTSSFDLEKAFVFMALSILPVEPSVGANPLLKISRLRLEMT